MIAPSGPKLKCTVVLPGLHFYIPSSWNVKTALTTLLPDVKPDYMKFFLGILKSVLAQAELHSATDSFHILIWLLCISGHIFSQYLGTAVRYAVKTCPL